jgi:hypothetical protein
MGVGNLSKKKAIENHYDPNRNGKSIAGSAQVCGTFPDFCLITPPWVDFRDRLVA